MLVTWLLTLFLVLPSGGVAKETINGFESRRECVDYANRYKSIEYRWRVEYLCEPVSSARENRVPRHISFPIDLSADLL